jgi:alkaline phosphatase D
VPRFPNTRIYRDFDFGKNLKLVVTDLRTFRPDHVIPEDAYPGKVVLDEPTLTAALGGVPAPFQNNTFAYVNIEDYPAQKQVLIGAYQQQARAAGVSDADIATKVATYIKGNLALAYINAVLSAANVPVAPPITPTSTPAKGVAYVHMGKQGLFGIQGSRYIVVKDTFDLYSQIMFGATQGQSENVLGTEQQAWFLDTMTKATNTWKVVVSSVSLTAMIWDLRQKSDIPDPTLRQRFYFNADQWDGFPSRKSALISALKPVSNPLFISGDIHASFVSVESARDPRTGAVINSVPALTTPAISSGSIQELAGTAVRGAGYTTESAVYRHAVANMDATMKEANPGLVYSNADNHGFVVVEVKANEALASYHLISSKEVGFDYSLRAPESLAEKFTRRDFRVQNGAITAL